MSKVAIVVDSGCNVPPKFAAEHGMYCLPLKIHYTDRTLRDGIDISPEEMYADLPRELPKTSLPTGEEIAELFAQIKADGYDAVCCVHLSSGLSGTFNAVRVIAEEEAGLAIKLIDTKNIAIGSGFVAMFAQELADKGASLDEVYEKTLAHITKSTVYFCVDTLEYLRKGGRIGLVASFLGERLNLKPVITCNPEGIYHTVRKCRGKKQASAQLIACAKAHVASAKAYRVCLSNGGTEKAELNAFRKEVKAAFRDAVEFYETDISATLGIHTGPGLLGVGVDILE